MKKLRFPHPTHEVHQVSVEMTWGHLVRLPFEIGYLAYLFAVPVLYNIGTGKVWLQIMSLITFFLLRLHLGFYFYYDYNYNAANVFCYDYDYDYIFEQFLITITMLKKIYYDYDYNYFG